MKVKSDLLNAMDNQEVTCLVLLDPSAAFDTVDHDLLLNTPKDSTSDMDMMKPCLTGFPATSDQKHNKC